MPLLPTLPSDCLPLLPPSRTNTLLLLQGTNPLRPLRDSSPSALHLRSVQLRPLALFVFTRGIQTTNGIPLHSLGTIIKEAPAAISGPTAERQGGRTKERGNPHRPRSHPLGSRLCGRLRVYDAGKKLEPTSLRVPHNRPLKVLSQPRAFCRNHHRNLQ